MYEVVYPQVRTCAGRQTQETAAWPPRSPHLNHAALFREPVLRFTPACLDGIILCGRLLTTVRSVKERAERKIPCFSFPIPPTQQTHTHRMSPGESHLSLAPLASARMMKSVKERVGSEMVREDTSDEDHSTEEDIDAAKVPLRPKKAPRHASKRQTA